MSTEAEHLSDAVRALFVSNDHGLSTSFATAVAGLTASQAASVPAARLNSVWAVVNHVRFWQEVTLLRLHSPTRCWLRPWPRDGPRRGS